MFDPKMRRSETNPSAPLDINNRKVFLDTHTHKKKKKLGVDLNRST